MLVVKYIKKVAPYFSGMRKELFGSILFGISLAGLKTLQAYIIKPIFDEGLNPSDGMETIIRVSLILLALIIINFPVRYYHYYWIRFATTEAMCRIRKQMYAKLSTMPLSTINGEKEGTIVSKLMLDTVTFSQGFRGLIDLVREPVTAILLFGLAFYRDWQLTMVMVIAAPFFSWAMKKSGRMIKSRQFEVQDKMGDLTHTVSEGVGSQKLTKAFSLERYSLDRFIKKQNDFFHWQMKSTRVEEFTHPVTEFITGLAFIGIIIFANYRIQTSSMTSGDFISFITAIAMLIDPLKKFSAAYMKFSQAVAAGDRVFDFINEKDEEDTGTQEINRFQKIIEINDLSFSYNNEQQVLKNISFSVTKGQKVAFVGYLAQGNQR